MCRELTVTCAAVQVDFPVGRSGQTNIVQCPGTASSGRNKGPRIRRGIVSLDPVRNPCWQRTDTRELTKRVDTIPKSHPDLCNSASKWHPIDHITFSVQGVQMHRYNGDLLCIVCKSARDVRTRTTSVGTTAVEVDPPGVCGGQRQPVPRRGGVAREDLRPGVHRRIIAPEVVVLCCAERSAQSGVRPRRWDMRLQGEAGEPLGTVCDQGRLCPACAQCASVPSSAEPSGRGT